MKGKTMKNRPNSAKASIFEAFLFSPRADLQNMNCNFSKLYLLLISSCFNSLIYMTNIILNNMT